MQIIKKDGTSEYWDNSKIIIAIKKSADRTNESISDHDMEIICNDCKAKCKEKCKDNIKTLDLHSIVISSLKNHGFINIANSYQEYRDYKNSYAKAWEQLKSDADTIIFLGDKENANFDSSLVSTKGSLIKGSLTKELYQQFYLSNIEKFLTKRGDIYIHDLRDMIFGSVNCCLFDIGNVLKDGFEMSGVKYSEPKTVLSALQVIGDITLVATAQQFGGFTLAEIDKVLLPYAKKSFKANYMKYAELIDDGQKIEEFAIKETIRELEQGFQSLELKLNTVPCSRGDFAFTTLTFGQWNTGLDNKDKFWLKTIGETILNTRKKGHNGFMVVFPKLVYLYDSEQIKNDRYSSELFDKAVQTSATCMYPDYLSLDGSPEVNKVAQEYKEYGTIISPMGCRSYVSHYEDENGPRTIGRCNIGVVSLNIPVIIAVAKREFGNDWKSKFWTLLDSRLETIRAFLKKRYDIIRHTKASTNPLAFTQGGFYKGNLKPDDEIGNLVQYMTASFGITALNESTILWNGKSIYEDKSQFANKVVDFILDRIEKYKKADGYLYALYGTPAESLCMKQAQQYKNLTGDDQFGEYFSNSFHCHVSENITPVEKQDAEFNLFHKVAGGHIQYVRIDNPENLIALKAIIQRGMEMGFYQGVNFDSTKCNECGQTSYNSSLKCPHCGSTNINTISRVCGYLGYSNLNGQTRMNDGKMCEIKDRVSM